MNAVAMEALRILKEQNALPSQDSPWVFLNEQGARLRSHRDWFEPALKESGVQDYSRRNRHAFASRLLMTGLTFVR